MERFREHEKEFKMKQYSKKALLHMGAQGESGSGSDGSNYGDENPSDEDLGALDEEEPVNGAE